jgi:tRNA pseudouridine13 synthase
MGIILLKAHIQFSMKIKQLPEDFVVEELSSIGPKKKGPVSLYLLEKNNLDVLAAKGEIRKKVKSKQATISFAGIKDKRAITKQYLTVKGKYGDKLNFKTKQISLTHLGFTQKPLKTGDLKGNRFTITLRDLNKDQVKQIKNNVEKIKQLGFINYFDSQRFGEALLEEGFIAKHLMRENYELALKLYFMPTEKISPERKKAYTIIQKNWGKWKKIQNEIQSLDGIKNELKVIYSLVEHSDFLKAFKIIDLKIREILMASYQSYLWNKALSQFIKSNLENTQEVKYAAGKLIFPKLETEDYNTVSHIILPMIDKDAIFRNPQIKEIMERILKKEKLTQEQLKLKKMGNVFLRSRLRDIVIHPKQLKILSEGEDTENIGKHQITIKFDLQKGSYATILLKTLEL